ncbi:MAG: TolC family protein [Planctomycetota bacterium]|jgi:outer membrane protein TolC
MKITRLAPVSLLLLSAGCAAFIWQDPHRVLSLRPKTAGTAREAIPKLIKERTGPDGTLTLSLQDCVFLALGRNLDLKAAREERLKAQGDAFTAFSAMLPKVSVNANYIRIDKGATAEFGGMRFKLSPEDRYSTELSIQQPIFQGGAALYAFEAAQIFSRISEVGVMTAREQIAFAAALSFWDALFARESLNVARENGKLAAAHLSDVKKRLAQGMATRFEALRAETQLAGMEALVIQAENLVKVKTLNLLRITTLPLGSRVRLDGEIKSKPVKTDFSEALRMAAKNRPDLKSAYLFTLAQEKQIDILRAQLMPKLYGFFNWGWEKPSSKSFIAGGGEGYWNGGISLSVPLFDGGATHGQLLKAYAGRRQAKYRFLDLQEKISLEIRKAILNLADAAQAVEAQAKNLRLAKEGRRLAQVGYENGVNTQLDLLDADNALVRAKFGHLQAIFGHIIAREALRQAVGVASMGEELPEPWGWAKPKTPREKKD